MPRPPLYVGNADSSAISIEKYATRAVVGDGAGAAFRASASIEENVGG
jgi:hypothetical protein